MPWRANRLLPCAQNVALGAEVDGVPRLVFGVPVVELVVMHALNNEKARAGIAIELDQRGGIKRGGI